MNKYKKILSFLVFTIFSFGAINLSSANIAKINKIDIIDKSTISIELSNNLENLSLENKDIKILQDLKILNSSKKENNNKKISIKLENELLNGYTYSIISISEKLDTSIDFTFNDTVNLYKNTGQNSGNTGTYIESVSIIDKNNIELNFSNEIVENIELKFFKELNIDTIFNDTTNINIKLKDNLSSNTNYIAVLQLKDNKGNDIEIENPLYDFVTGEFEEISNNSSSEEKLLDNDLNSASKEEQKKENEEKNIDQVALNEVSSTPETGTKTTILLLITLLITIMLIYFSRKTLKI